MSEEQLQIIGEFGRLVTEHLIKEGLLQEEAKEKATQILSHNTAILVHGCMIGLELGEA